MREVADWAKGRDQRAAVKCEEREIPAKQKLHVSSNGGNKHWRIPLIPATQERCGGPLRYPCSVCLGACWSVLALGFEQCCASM